MALVQIFGNLKLTGRCLPSLGSSLLSQRGDLLDLRGVLVMAKGF